MSLTVINQPPKKWRTYAKAPFVTVAKAYLLTDDFIYRRVDEVARATEFVSDKLTKGRFVVTRKGLTEDVAIGVPVISAFLDTKVGMFFPLMAFTNYAIIRTVVIPRIEKLFEGNCADGAVAINPAVVVTKRLRLPYLVVGIWTAYSFLLGTGGILIGVSLAYYLAGGSNGMVDRANDALHDFLKRVKGAIVKKKDEVGALLPDGGSMPEPIIPSLVS
ncbi:MAG: hypothetical protein Q7S22_06860 [Candidatus Micrarchaeota archaeon]|nr:hypothetical protein [Candidatus Micrarchaeota archaeon]